MRFSRSLCALLAVSVTVVLSGCGASPRSTVDRRPQPPASPSPLRPPLAVDRAYRDAVGISIARDLDVPLGELKLQLRSLVRAAPGSDLMSLAKPLGFAQDQLGAIVLASLNRAADAAVRSRRWVPAGARKEKRYWTSQPAPSLIAEASRWLVRS
jgi:hypothetical protein